jgi:hypothetical protein
MDLVGLALQAGSVLQRYMLVVRLLRCRLVIVPPNHVHFDSLIPGTIFS